MNKLTLAEKLHQRKMKKPPFIYNILGVVWKILFFKKYGIKVNYKKDPRLEKGPYIVISNHASRLDYIFVGLPLLPKRYNFVVGYNEYFRSHLAPVFNILKPIPKKNFTADIYTVKEVNRVLKNNGRIIIFPEGMSSISGANQPVAIGTGKFIKHFKIPVYYSVIKGGYLTSPKYHLEDRYGKVEVTFDQLFTPEDIDKLSPEEIEDKMNLAIYHDDYEWNLKEKNIYKHKGNIAKNMHQLLYWCPKCNMEFKMLGESNTIRCTNCGNGATIDDTYQMHPFDETCVIPRTQTVWFNQMRERVKEEIKQENFEMSFEVELGTLPKYKLLKNQKTSEIVGKGKVIINKEGFNYIGTKNNEEFNFHLNPSEVPTYGMCTDVSRFYTFYKGEFYEFYPDIDLVEKVFLVTEEIHRLNGGKWQDFKFEINNK